MNFYLLIFKDSKVYRGGQEFAGCARTGRRLPGSNHPTGRTGNYINEWGAPGHPLTDAISLTVNCSSQEDVDYHWNRLLEGGGKEIACGWFKGQILVFIGR